MSYSAQYLTISHWNLNRTAAHNFIKVALLKVYLSVHDMDIVWLSEIYLDSFVPIDNKNLQIPGYIYHPSNAKRAGVLVYYKSYLPLELIDVKYLHEWINVELRIGEKICKFLSLYRSPKIT